MKKLIALLSLLFVTNHTFAQKVHPDTTKKEFKNIVGLDATWMVRQLINSGSPSSGYNYYSPYFISYRRIFGGNAVRAQIGGMIWTTESKTNDTTRGITSRNNYYFTLGFEHYKYLSKRFTCYFGIDLTTSYREYKTKGWYTNTEYSEQIQTTSDYGFTPLLGLVFEITSRMSVATETGYNISYQTSISSTKRYPPTIWDTKKSEAGWISSFYAPASIIFRFKI